MIKQAVNRVRKSTTNKSNKKTNRLKKGRKGNRHNTVGTSKLEDKFAEEFLEKNGIAYQRQYEAKDIKRFYDFYLPDSNILIEIDGDYW